VRPRQYSGSRWLLWSCGCLVALAIALAYLPDVGAGFVKDDYGWIVSSRVREPGDLTRLFVETRGFYRPVVSLSFAVNEYIGGLSTFTYGLTDFLVAIACGTAIVWLTRALGLPAGAVLLLVLIASERPRLSVHERRVVLGGLTWLGVGFSITVFVPVRSSLYACFPAVGVAVAGAAVAAAVWRAMSPGRRNAAIVAAVLTLGLLVPVQRMRSSRWVELATLTATVDASLEAAGRLAADGHVAIVDDRSTRVSVSNAYGSLLPDAVLLFSGERRVVWVVPPLPGTPTHEVERVPRAFSSTWGLSHGRLGRIDGATIVGAEANALR